MAVRKSISRAVFAAAAGSCPSGPGIVPSGYHPLADQIPDNELMQLVDGVRGVIATCVAAMPEHEQFIARYCAAPEAA